MGVARHILEILKDEPRQTPSSLVKKMRAKGSTVRNCLVFLKDLRLVETPSRGLYRVSSLGEYVLDKAQLLSTKLEEFNTNLQENEN